MLTLVAFELLRRQSREPAPWTIAVAVLSAGALFAFSRSLWAYATVAEVYALNIALVLVTWLLVLRWAASGRDVLLYSAAVAFGVALGVHHVTVALTLPALIWLVVRARGGRALVGKPVLAAAAIAVGAAALTYASIPLAASREAGLNWGDPETIQRLWWHVTGRQYQAFFDFSWSRLGDSLGDAARYLVRQFGPPWLPLALVAAVAGAFRLFVRDRTGFWFLVLVVVPNVGYVLVYPISEDRDAYLLPTYAALALAVAVAVEGLVAALASRRMPALAVTTLAILPAVAFGASLRFDDRSGLYAAHDYADGILGSVGEGGLVLTYDWEVYSPLLYVQEVERERRDVVAIDGNLLRRPWYFDYLERRYPALMASARRPVALYLDDLRRFEQHPARYERGENNRRIEARFQKMIEALLRAGAQSGPAYATQDIDREQATAARLARRYTFVPHGLVLELYPDSRFHDPPPARFRLRGVTDGALRIESDDVIRKKVVPAIDRMLTLRAAYLEYFGRDERARRAFEEADRFRNESR